MPDRLRAMFCDPPSLMRGKYLPASKMKSDGTRLARPSFAEHWNKDLLLDAPHTETRQGIPDMELRWDEGDNCVYKTGPAVEVFSGEWAP